MRLGSSERKFGEEGSPPGTVACGACSRANYLILRIPSFRIVDGGFKHRNYHPEDLLPRGSGSLTFKIGRNFRLSGGSHERVVAMSYIWAGRCCSSERITHHSEKAAPESPRPRISNEKRARFRRSTLPPRTTAASAPAGFPAVAAHPSKSNKRIGPGSATLSCRAKKGEYLDGSGKPGYVRI